ncbi:MAG: glycosyltransferase family 2 protein [Parabacteroides gordonii]|uniref:glycosyltransferase family 2 protein n=1 Tax=Parabacteroides gordonii TaxID=574930 RepID=UPI003A8BA955
MVSIIIPCYNTEHTLAKCLQTLLEQNYHNWEAICVNDGSLDSTEEILNRFSRLDNRIKVFTQKNLGAAKARELGVQKAIGEFITFLDADDTFTPDTLTTALQHFNTETDIVVFSFNIINNDKTIKCKKTKPNYLLSISYLKKVLSGQYGWELWAKIYRKNIFYSPITVPSDIRIGEDAAIFIQLVCKAKYIRIINKPLYNYIQYSNSASHIQSTKYAEETLKSAYFINNHLIKFSFYKDIKNEISAMFLLFYSNSTRKAYLDKNNLLIQDLKRHLRFSALIKLPALKAIYICLSYFCFQKVHSHYLSLRAK